VVDASIDASFIELHLLVDVDVDGVGEVAGMQDVDGMGALQQRLLVSSSC
jgi:hypothetical protein